MSDPTPNIALLDRLEETLIARPEQHDQGWWLTDAGEYDQDGFVKVDCETTLCAAGWAATLEGGKWVTSSYLLATDADREEGLCIQEQYLQSDYRTEVDSVSAYARAKRLLGLTEDEAHEMFYQCEDLPEIQDVMRRVRERAARMAEEDRCRAS